MEKTAFDARYQEYLAAIEDYLNSLFAEKPHWADLYEAMRYSVLSGGKRLRPVMTLEFARLCGLDWHKAVPMGLPNSSAFPMTSSISSRIWKARPN